MKISFRRFSAALALLIAVCCAAPLMAADEFGPVKTEYYSYLYQSVLAGAGLKPADIDVYSMGQSHIDAAWRWRKKQTRDKCIKTFGNAVKHMAMYPDFHFSGSAPQYYEWVLEDDPALFQKIVEWEKKGQWEIVGGQWVEPDNNMPDGESFCRQRLLGQRFYQEHFGHVADISWLLDSFGYNQNLPQFLAKSGAKYFWTNKLTWNDTTIFPFHFFWWEAPDGSKVLSYFIGQVDGANQFFPLSEINKYYGTRYLLPEGAAFTANYATGPAAIKAALSTDWLNIFGVFYGTGDGGHGPKPREIKVQRALQSQGYTKLARASELYAALEKHASRAPTWKDELYLEYHRGCQTTQGQVKRGNRKSEQMMRTAEVLQSIASRHGFAYAYGKLKAVWKLVLLNQFHDILPGSSIPEVYEDADKDYAEIFQKAGEAVSDALSYLAGKIDTRGADAALQPVLVFNSLGWKRSGTVGLKGLTEENISVVDASGKAVLSQWADCQETGKKKLLFRADDVPSLGYKVYYLKEGAEAAADSSLSARDESGKIVLANGMVETAVDKQTGWLISVRDAGLGREFLASYGNRLSAYHDRTRDYPAWNINPNYLKEERPMSAASSAEITARGPLFVEVTVKRRFQESDIVQVIRVFARDPKVHLATHFDFHDHDLLVKAGFDTTLKGDKIFADAPYSVIGRPTHPMTAAEKAQWEMVCHKWIDLSDGTAGLALLNNGKYGFSLNGDGTGYRLTMLKAALYPDSAPEAVEVQYASMPQPWRNLLVGELFTDQGPHSVYTALLPHAGDWKAARLWEAGYEFNTPFEAMVVDQHAGELPTEASFVAIDNPDVYIGAVKKAEDDDALVLRLVEALGAARGAVVSFNKMGAVSGAAETDILEWNPQPLESTAGSLNLSFQPNEVKTVKVSFSR